MLGLDPNGDVEESTLRLDRDPMRETGAARFGRVSSELIGDRT